MQSTKREIESPDNNNITIGNLVRKQSEMKREKKKKKKVKKKGDSMYKTQWS